MGLLSNPFSPDYNVAGGLPGYVQMTGPGQMSGVQQFSRDAINQQQSFVNAIGGLGGLNANQNNVFNQQQGLANQFQQVAAGQGPNPAQAMLAQNTGQNIQQQAALMGSARGAQSNPGLIARQAAQQGGNLQQQAVGQAATLGAQQQLAGMQGLASQQGQMANLATAGAGQQQTALSQLGDQNLNYQQQYQNLLTAQNQQQVQAQAAQAGLAAEGMKNSAGLIGGLVGGVAGGIGKILGLAEGGQVSPVTIQQHAAAALPNSFQPLSGIQSTMSQNFSGQNGQPSTLYSGANQLGSTLGNALGSGVKSVLGSHASGDDGGGSGGSMVLASGGGKISGKAKASGDSKKNDTVPAMLSPGEIVIPRSHISPDKAAQFLNGLMGWKLKAA